MKHLSHWAEAETLKVKFKLKISQLGYSSVLGSGLKRAAQLRLAAAEFVSDDEAALTGKEADSDGSGGPRPKRLMLGLAHNEDTEQGRGSAAKTPVWKRGALFPALAAIHVAGHRQRQQAVVAAVHGRTRLYVQPILLLVGVYARMG